MRINARLDDSSEKAFEYLKQNTGQTSTEIIKHSLELYVKELEDEACQASQRLLKDLAGIGSGPEDLSENYKEYLTGSLNEKHPPG